VKKIASYEYFIPVPQNSMHCVVDSVCKLKCFTDRIVHMPTNGFRLGYPEDDFGGKFGMEESTGFCLECPPPKKKNQCP